MNIEIINTGSELLLGRVLNTHQQWLCRCLADRGYLVTRQVAVTDSGASIREAVAEALRRAQLIVVTGGLGPTSDDLTRDYIAELLGMKLKESRRVLTQLERFYLQRRRPMPERVRVQALVPAGARVLPNAHGTAPGLAIPVARRRFAPEAAPVEKAWLILLPGPPRELRPMFLEHVMPLVQAEFPIEHPFVCRTLRSTGLGESLVEERLAPRLQPLCAAGLEIGYCARSGEVDVRLSARGRGAAAIVGRAERLVRRALVEYIFGEEEELLEQVLVRLLTDRKQTLALAESCTGGLLAHRLTNVPGASAVLLGGVVSYSNAAKEQLLGVRKETLLREGAVSEATAREMADGARRVMGADYALAVTGIAGPGGGSRVKPVGTVFLALAGGGRGVVQRQFNPVDRETFKYMTSQQAFELLRRRLMSVE